MSEHFNPEMGGAEQYEHLNQYELAEVNKQIIFSAEKTKENLHSEKPSTFTSRFLRNSDFRFCQEINELSLGLGRQAPNHAKRIYEDFLNYGIIFGVKFGENLSIKRKIIERHLISGIIGLNLSVKLKDKYEYYNYEIEDFLSIKGPMSQVAENVLNLDAEPLIITEDKKLQNLINDAMVFSSGMAIEYFIVNKIYKRTENNRNKLEDSINKSLFRRINMEYFITRNIFHSNKEERTKGPLEKMFSQLLSNSVEIPQDWIDRYKPKE